MYPQPVSNEARGSSHGDQSCKFEAQTKISTHPQRGCVGARPRSIPSRDFAQRARWAPSFAFAFAFAVVVASASLALASLALASVPGNQHACTCCTIGYG